MVNIKFSQYLSHLSIFLTEMLHANSGIRDMKHIKWDFSLNARVLDGPSGLGQSKNHIRAAYQIKGKEVYNIMQANILPLHTFDHLGGVKGSFFVFSESSHDANQINESNFSVVLHTLDHWRGSKGQSIFFLKMVMLHIKLKGKKCRIASKMFELIHTPGLLGWIKRSDIKIVQISIF